MYFLIQDGKIAPHQGTLDGLDPQVASLTTVALESDTCYEQKLIWVQEGQAPRVKGAKSPGKKPSIVLMRDGTLAQRDIDPAEPCEDVEKIYPIKAKFIRRYVPIKIDIETAESLPKTRKPRKPKTDSAK